MSDLCGKCKGKGVIDKYGHVAQGLCFRCYGTGGVDKDSIRWAKDYHVGLTPLALTVTQYKPLTRDDKIKELKEALAHTYIDLVEPLTSIGRSNYVQAGRKESVRQLYDELVGLGYTMSKSEMFELGKRVRGK